MSPSKKCTNKVRFEVNLILLDVFQCILPISIKKSPPKIWLLANLRGLHFIISQKRTTRRRKLRAAEATEREAESSTSNSVGSGAMVGGDDSGLPVYEFNKNRGRGREEGETQRERRERQREGDERRR